MHDVFDRHQLACLQFSGGKDSLACLWLIEPWWAKTVVLWVNTGAAFPETLELMEKVRAMVPHFLEERTDQPAQVKRKGYPVDVLPIVHHKHFPLNRHPRLQGFLDCCYENIMEPAEAATKRLGATLVIRGQKDADCLKGTLQSGQKADGQEFLYPIESWTDEEVFSYLKQTPLGVPAHYDQVGTSLDCWSCTAYLGDNLGKMRYLRDKHPEWHSTMTGRLTLIRDAVRGADFTKAALDQ